MKRYRIIISVLVIALALTACNPSTELSSTDINVSHTESLSSDTESNTSDTSASENTSNSSDNSDPASTLDEQTSDNDSKVSDDNSSGAGDTDSSSSEQNTQPSPENTQVSTQAPVNSSTPASTKPVSKPSTNTPSSNVKYTDGNVYFITDDMHYIVKVDPNFSGHTIMYEGKFDESIRQPIYRNGALFFTRFDMEGNEQIYKLDVATKKVTSIFKSSQLPGYDSWFIVDDKIMIYTISDKYEGVLWMCNLDGSGLKRTSASSSDGLHWSNEINGKLYLVSNNGYTATFYEMKKDGAGFKKLFTQYHIGCHSFCLLGADNTHIYYSVGSINRDDSIIPLVGCFKVKLDGSNREYLTYDTDSYGAVDDKAAYIVTNSTNEGLTRIDKSGKITKMLY